MKKKQTKYESALDIAVSPLGGTNSRECEALLARC